MLPEGIINWVLILCNKNGVIDVCVCLNFSYSASHKNLYQYTYNTLHYN